VSIVKSDLKSVDVLRKLMMLEPLAELPQFFQTLLGKYYAPILFYNWRGVEADMPANRLFATFYPVFRKIRFDRIGTFVEGAGAAGARMRLGVYSNLNFKPDKLILDAGEVEAETTGQKELAIDLTLEPGRYWTVFLTNDPTIDLPFFDFFLNLWKKPDDLKAGEGSYEADQTYGPLPSTFPTGWYALRYRCVFLRVAELL